MGFANGAKILLLLRNREAADWESLSRGLDIDPKNPRYRYQLTATLKKLRGVGLVDFEGDDDPTHPIEGQIVITQKWLSIQDALNTSLTQLSDIDRSKSMVVRPYWGQPSKDIGHADVFVAMPFHQDLKHVFDNHIKKVVENLGLVAKRADNIFTAKAFIQNIWSAICESRAVVADCTGKNPNVFYEIGMAHSVGKPVILITQNSDDVPSDLKHNLYIPYENTLEGLSRLEQALLQTFKTELSLSCA
ncbi:MAG TPA: hypothetical protein VF553_07175 [Pyrinomonadaceae bacterium]